MVYNYATMAYAIVETGGKQYRVVEGGSIVVEKLVGKAGDTVVFDKVLLLDDGVTTKVGMPYLEGVTVSVSLAGAVRGKKLLVQKFRAKSRYKRRLGHRQEYTKLSGAQVAAKK